MAELAGLAATDVDLQDSPARYGLGSADAVGLAGELAGPLRHDSLADALLRYPDMRAALASLPLRVDPTSRKVEAGRRFQRARVAVAGEAVPAAASSAFDPIAIVGMSGRFPAARDIEQLWQRLLHGHDCIGELPAERWGLRAGDLGRQPAGVLEGADQFDPLFFGISPREAELMDPQQRLMMTYIWKAIEDAGYSRGRALRAAGPRSWWGRGAAVTPVADCAGADAVDGYSATGVVPSVGPNRMSYLPRSAWSERADRDGVLEFAGGGASGDAGAGERRMRDGDRRRRQHAADAGRRISASARRGC